MRYRSEEQGLQYIPITPDQDWSNDEPVLSGVVRSGTEQMIAAATINSFYDHCVSYVLDDFRTIVSLRNR